MPKTFSLTLPDEQHRFLVEEAAKSSQSPEEVATEILVEMLKNMSEDPLLKNAGTIKTNIPNVASRHDELIGQSLFEEMQGGHG